MRPAERFNLRRSWALNQSLDVAPFCHHLKPLSWSTTQPPSQNLSISCLVQSLLSARAPFYTSISSERTDLSRSHSHLIERTTNMKFAITALAVLSACPTFALGAYNLARNYSGEQFFNGFTYYGNFDNLTNGSSITFAQPRSC